MNDPLAEQPTSPRHRNPHGTWPGQARDRQTLPGLGPSQAAAARSFKAEASLLPLDGHLPTGTGTVYEISQRGVFVHSQASLALGTLVLLRLTTELGSVSFTARVVQSVRHCGLGCQFVDLDQRQRAMLSILIALASPRTARAVGRAA